MCPLSMRERGGKRGLVFVRRNEKNTTRTRTTRRRRGGGGGRREGKRMGHNERWRKGAIVSLA